MFLIYWVKWCIITYYYYYWFMATWLYEFTWWQIEKKEHLGAAQRREFNCSS